MSDKPSRNEDEYFAREEAEKIARLRAQEERSRIATERKSHYMKCPKDGSDLKTIEFHAIQVDHCGECGGLWLDRGEVDVLLKHEDPGLFRKVLGDVASALSRRKGGR
ncbi:MAG: zf-TFIIB domain-containing protein [Gemmatimonadales bacterium]